MNRDLARPDALPSAPQDRKHVRQAQGLAALPTRRSLPTTFRIIGAVQLLRPLRPMRAHLHVRHRNRRNRDLLGCDQ